MLPAPRQPPSQKGAPEQNFSLDYYEPIVIISSGAARTHTKAFVLGADYKTGRRNFGVVNTAGSSLGFCARRNAKRARVAQCGAGCQFSAGALLMPATSSGVNADKMLPPAAYTRTRSQVMVSRRLWLQNSWVAFLYMRKVQNLQNLFGAKLKRLHMIYFSLLLTISPKIYVSQ